MRPALVILIVATLLATSVPFGPSPFGNVAAGTGVPVFTNHAAPSTLFNADGAGEPSIGVNWNTGNVMFQSWTSTYRVTFSDATTPATATWVDVAPVTSVNNIDPMLFTDPVKGRTFAGGLNGECSIMSYTDDDGSSWTQMGNVCTGAFDHQSIASGPWKGSRPLLATYDRAVYYCAQTGTIACALSQDGGLTFGAPATVGGACGSLHGSIRVAPDGTAYVPTSHCGGKQGGGKTTNNGGSWSSYTIAQSAEPSDGFDPQVAIQPDNTIWESWSHSNFHPYVARSTNGGSTWDRVSDLSSTVNPPLAVSTFQETIAGDNGRVAVAFLGSTTGGDPFVSGWPGVWHLYVSYTYDAGLTWTTVQATTDPVQRGWICAGGTGCGSGRNLLDFIDMQVTKDGRVVVAYADGCVSACAGPSGTEAQSTSAWATIARQSAGKGLFAAYDGTGPSTPSAPVLSGSAGNAQASLSWTTPANGGSTITGYRLYRDGALQQSLGVTNSFTDTGLTNGQSYVYEVSAVNAVGESARSNARTLTPQAANQAPTSCFTHAESGLATSVDGSCSSDSDGTIGSYSWNWGDGSPASSGATAGHTYAAAGTYSVTLTVTDNAGATASSSQGVSVTSPGDPDPGAFTLTSGVAQSDTNGAADSWKYYKIQVPSGKSQLSVVLDGQACGLLSCNPDLDLYVKRGARPTSASNDCGPEESDSDETCTLSGPAADWWYVGVFVFSGSSAKTYTIRATYS